MAEQEVERVGIAITALTGAVADSLDAQAKTIDDIRADIVRLAGMISSSPGIRVDPVTLNEWAAKIQAATTSIRDASSQVKALSLEIDTTADTATGVDDDAPPPLPAG